MKKENTTVVVFFLIVVVLIGVLFLTITGFTVGGANLKIVSEGDDGVTIINQHGDPALVNEAVPLCDWFTDNYPAYITSRSSNCVSAGGDWDCEDDKVGCYTIPLWDHATQCSSAETAMLDALCDLAGGDWTCNAREAGCER